MPIIRVIDLETSGLNPDDEVVEAGWVELNTETGMIGNAWQGFAKPTKPIPAEASAIHHLTDADVASAQPWPLAGEFLTATGTNIDYFAAHKAQFDAQWFTEKMRGGRQLLCTYKAALRVWPEAPAHSNQVLRYWLKLNVEGTVEPPHRAAPDAFVTAHLLREILKHATIADMIAWTAEPPVLPKILFGKHKDKAWSNPPSDYLEWIVGKSDMDEDVKWNARRELSRRSGAVRAAYVDASTDAIMMMNTVSDLMGWFTGQTQTRTDLGIEKSSPEYDRIVTACAARKATIMAIESVTTINLD